MSLSGSFPIDDTSLDPAGIVRYTYVSCFPVNWLLWAALPAFLLAVATAARSSRYRFASVNVAAASLAVLLFVGYDWLAHRVSDQFEPAGWTQPHDILGYLPRPNQTVRWTKRLGFHGVEDRETYPYLVGEDLGASFATYNISANGWGPHRLLAAPQSGLSNRLRL